MEERKAKKKSAFRIIFDIFFWIFIIALAAVWLTDFFKVQNKQDPMFCISEKTHEFEDGTVNECTGLGYKVFVYHRKSIEAYQFGPFFIKMEE